MSAPEDAANFLALDRSFDAALARIVSGAPCVSILFSGGVDSSLVAAGARRHGPVQLVAIGTAGAKDEVQARSAARLLDLPIEFVRIPDAEVEELLARRIPALDELREPMRSVQVALSLALPRSRESTVLVGQGADELFGGYAHFRNLDREQSTSRRRADWERLRQVDWPTSMRIAADLGKDLRSPFLDEEFAQIALGIPVEAVGDRALTKPLMRRWALHRNLPEAIASRPKLAMQYGSGVSRVVERIRPHRTPASSAGSR